MTITNAFAAAALIAMTAAPAFAGRPEMPEARVRYADLDLGQAKDVARLRRRVATALESVCGSYAGADLTEANDIRRCRDSVAAKAEPMVAMLITHEQPVTFAGR